MSPADALMASPPTSGSRRRWSDELVVEPEPPAERTTAAGRRRRPPRRDTVNAQSDHPLRATLVSRDDVRRHLVVQVDPDHASVRVELVAPGASDGASGRGACAISRPSRASVTAVARIDLEHDPREEYPDLDVTLAVTWSREINGRHTSTDISGTALLFSADGRPPEEFRAINADPDTARTTGPVAVAPHATPAPGAPSVRGHARIRLPRPGRARPGRAPRTEPGGRWSPGFAFAMRHRHAGHATAACG